MPQAANAFYLKVAGLCFVVCATLFSLNSAAWPCLKPFDIVVSFTQMGGCMEGFMIKTGFYDKYVSPRLIDAL